MPELEYMPKLVLSREAVAAEKHLLVWTWVFYSLAGIVGMAGMLGAWDFFRQIPWGAEWLSMDVLLPFAIGLIFFGAVAFILWAMGRRCGESRQCLLQGNWPGYVWAVHAFNAVLAISVLILLGTGLVILTVVLSGQNLGMFWMFPGGIAMVIGFSGWTCHRVSRAWTAATAR